MLGWDIARSYKIRFNFLDLASQVNLLDPALTSILQELARSRSYHLLGLTKMTCKNGFLGIERKFGIKLKYHSSHFYF